jgi:hypothetical protein
MGIRARDGRAEGAVTMAMIQRVCAVGCLALLPVACAAEGPSDDGGDPGATPPTAMRVDSLTLLDPHAFALGALDVTGTVNDALAEAIETDSDGDGVLGLSIVTVFRPLAPAQTSGALDVLFPDCSAPLATTACARTAETLVLAGRATNSDGGCLVPDAATLGGYSPAPQAAAGRCFTSDAVDVELAVGALVIPLRGARIAAAYGAAAGLEQGLIVGFLTRAAAEATTLPADLPLVGGDSLASLLHEDDVDPAPGGGGDGWWFYLGFGAGEVALSE